ncbi:L-seryl-tRNA(Sec) selenium transferase [Mesorhizobium sp. M1143]|uniref:L-seryl-tRNA(Sec) selenium transferase n=1 Tax=Mesorhizobium sp. M1143 TaxID=2957061 RepID=UPI00333D3679
MSSNFARFPSVDRILRSASGVEAAAKFGHSATVSMIRICLASERVSSESTPTVEKVGELALSLLKDRMAPRIRPVFNLTGTVLHTNLGRASLAEEAIESATTAMRRPVNIEYNLNSGRRGERDDHIADLLCELTGAEAATVVNNNAAALLLTLNTLSQSKDAIVSRGELIEIGGSFRLPEIMQSAGARLVEVGTTNRTHARDYERAMGAETGTLLKVHTSNFKVQGFTAEVSTKKLSSMCRPLGVPLVFDLGSGSFVDMSTLGLPHEPTVRECVNEGPDLVLFSGDKVLGGVQAGFIVGRKKLVEKINQNPMKRALRVDKIRFAAIEATLKLYLNQELALRHIPTLRLLTRPREKITEVARMVLAHLKPKLGAAFSCKITECESEIGSGAAPTATIPSVAIAIRPKGDASVVALEEAMRRLQVPVLGRISHGTMILDFRCLEEESIGDFVKSIGSLKTRQSP